jgi:hypothetical protein
MQTEGAENISTWETGSNKDGENCIMKFVLFATYWGGKVTKGEMSGGHVARMGDRWNLQNIAKKSKDKGPSRSLWCRWEIRLICILTIQMCEMWTRFIGFRIGSSGVGSCRHDNEPLGSVKDMEFQPSDHLPHSTDY